MVNSRRYPNNYGPTGVTRKEALINDDKEIKDAYIHLRTVEQLVDRLAAAISSLYTLK